MDEKRLNKIKENIAKHEERKRTQNIMGDVDSSMMDRSNSSYNRNDAAYEKAKQYYQAKYVPRKAQEYYDSVNKYKSPYTAVNKPSVNNTTVITPENETANLLSDGINVYVNKQMRDKAQKSYNDTFNSENKKYAEQYSRLNANGKKMYDTAEKVSNNVNSYNNSIDSYYSQFKDENDYYKFLERKKQAEETQRLLDYNVPAAEQRLMTMKATNMNPSKSVEESEEYKSIVADIEKAKSAQEFAKNMQNENFRKQYEEYEQHQKDYENKNVLEKAEEQVGNAVADVIYNYGSGMYGVAESITGVVDSVLGRNKYEEGTLSNTIHDFYGYVHDEADRRQRFSSYAQQGLTSDIYNATKDEQLSNFLGGAISITLNSIADAGLSMAMAALSGGTSLASKGIQSTVGLSKTQQAARAASSMAKGMTKDLNFWTSFAREGGSAYNDAIASGATNEEATIAMLATGLPNAYIEVGGGVEKFQNLNGTGIKGWLRDFAKSTGEEATEELKQGVIAEFVKKLIYAPETKLFSTAEDGSGVINPIRMYQEAYGGAVGGAFGGSVGKAINVASYTVANNMYKSDSMRDLIQSGKYTEMLKAMPDSDFKNSKISKEFSESLDEKQTLAKLKKISNGELIKQYDSMIDALSTISEGNVASLIYAVTGDSETATQIAPVLRKLYDGESITEQEAKAISRNESVVSMLGETTGIDLSSATWKDFVALAEKAQFENESGTSTDNPIADVVLGNAQRAEAGREYVANIQEQYANELSGTPTFTAKIGDETVKIDGIDRIENGEVFVKLSNGTVQEAQSLDTDEVTTALLGYASKFNPETASAFINGYNGNTSVGEYARSFSGVYAAALTGMTADRIAASAPLMVSNIRNDTVNKIIENGNRIAQKNEEEYSKRQAKLKASQASRLDSPKVTDNSKGTADTKTKSFATLVSKATGYEIELTDSSKNGAIDTLNGNNVVGAINTTEGKITIDLASEDAIGNILHEVTHYLSLNAEEEYKALVDFTVEWLTNTGRLEYYLEKYCKTYATVNVSDLVEEMVSDESEGLLSNPKFLEEILLDEKYIRDMADSKPNILERIIKKIKQAIGAIKNFIANNDTIGKEIARDLAENQNKLEEYEKLWISAFKAATRNHKAESTEAQSIAKENDGAESNGEVKYSISYTTDNRPVVVVNDDITKYTYNKKDIVDVVKSSLGKFKRVPIKRQSIYFISDTKSEYTNSKYTQYIRHNDNEIYLDKMRMAAHPQDIVYATTDYVNEGLRHSRKDNIVDFARGRILLDVLGRKYSAEVVIGLTKSGLCELHDIVGIVPTSFEYKKEATPKPIDSNESGRSGVTSNSIVTQPHSKVNPPKEKFSVSETDSDGNKLSEQQREYFKDSKVVDKDGRLKVMYHQTEGEFTVFDTRRRGAGSRDNETPFGVFLKESDKDIGLKGKKQMKLYVNIVNPLVVENRQQLVYELGKLSPKYAQYMQISKQIDNEYADKTEAARNAFKEYIIEVREKERAEGKEPAERKDLYKDEEFMRLFNEEDRLADEWTEKAAENDLRAKEAINKALADNGYDGVILRNDVGSWGRKTEAYIALNSNQVKNVDNLNPTENEDIRFSVSEDFSYNALIKKPDMSVPVINQINLPLDNDGKIIRSKVVSDSLANIRKAGNPMNTDNKVFLYNESLQRNVKISPDGIKHGLSRKAGNNAVASLALSDYFGNAICVNELEPRDGMNKSYVLLGAFNYNQNDYYVRMIVNENRADSISYVEDINVLYALNTKKEPAALKRPGLSLQKTAHPATGSVLSVADFLNNVKNHFPDVLSNDILAHYGLSRPKSTINGLKYSVSEPDEARYRILERDNEELRRQVETLKSEMTLTKGHKVNPQVVRKQVNRLLREYSSEADADEIYNRVYEIYDYISNNKNANAEQAQQAMYDVAGKIISKSQKLDTTLHDDYKNVLEYLRNNAIKVTPQLKAAIEYRYDDYNAFRKANFGRLKLSTENGLPIDVYAKDLNGMSPGVINSELMSEGDLLDELMEFIEMTRPFYDNPYAEDIETYQMNLASEIFDNYFDTPEIHTYADKQAAKLRKLVNENRKRVAEVRAKTSEAYKKRLSELRTQKNQKISEIRKDRDEKLLRQKAKYQDMAKRKMEKRKESQERYRLKTQILKHVKSLRKDLLANSKEHHVPEVLKDVTARMLANIDLMTNESRESLEGDTPTKVAIKLQNDLTELQNFIALHGTVDAQGNAKTGGDVDSDFDMNFDPDLVANIQEIKNHIDLFVKGNVARISDMNNEELTALHNMLAALRHAINTVDEAYSDRIKEKISTIAEGSINEMSGKKDRNPFNKNLAMKAVGLADTYFNSNMLDSRSYFVNLGDSSFKIHRALRDGLNSYISHIKEAQEYFEQAKKGFKPSEIKKLINEYKEYEVAGGKISLSKAQIMTLYELSKRKAAQEHIYKGGIRATDLKGKRQVKPIAVSEADIVKICSELSEKEKNLADAYQRFLATTCATWGNETSMNLYGYYKYIDPDYFPMTVFDATVKTNDKNAPDNASLYSVLNYGMTKSLTPHANNALDISDIFGVAERHVEEMSSHSAYSAPITDAMRWFNYQNREAGESVKQSLYAKYGANGKRYFLELIKGLNRQKPTGDYGSELSTYLIAAQKAAAVAGNLSVVIQQPTAIVRALAEMDPDIVAKGMAVATSHLKQSMQEAQKNAPIAWWKAQGYFETSMGKSLYEMITGISTAKDKVVEKSMALAGKADDVTWGAIWEASKLWVQKYNPNLDTSSEEFMNAVKEKFDDVIDQTQVVDSILHRPMILRSKNAIVKMDMSFMAEPLKSANLIRNAIVNVKNGKPQAVKRLVRVSFACVLSNVAAAAAKAVIMAMRDTGDDDWLEKWLESFTGDLLSALNPLGIIPLVKDIFSILDGYDVERMDMSAITGLVQFVQQAVEYASKDKLDDALNLQNIYKLTRYVSQLTGIPVYNVLREVDTWVFDLFGDPVFRTIKATPDSETYTALYNAAMSNNNTAMQNQYDKLGKTQKEVESALKSKITDENSDLFNENVDKAAKARLSGDIKTAVNIVRQLAETTALSKDFWTACVNSRINKLEKQQTKRDKLIASGISKEIVDTMSNAEVDEAVKSLEVTRDDGTAVDLNEDINVETLYTASDLVDALKNNNEGDYSTMYEEIVSAKAVALIMQAEKDGSNLDTDEAEEKAVKSVKASVTKALKPEMKELYKTDKKKFNKMKKKIMKKFGYSSSQISGWLKNE